MTIPNKVSQTILSTPISPSEDKSALTSTRNAKSDLIGQSMFMSTNTNTPKDKSSKQINKSDSAEIDTPNSIRTYKDGHNSAIKQAARFMQFETPKSRKYEKALETGLQTFLMEASLEGFDQENRVLYSPHMMETPSREDRKDFSSSANRHHHSVLQRMCSSSPVYATPTKPMRVHIEATSQTTLVHWTEERVEIKTPTRPNSLKVNVHSGPILSMNDGEICNLKCHSVSKDAFKRITPETLLELIKGRFRDTCSKYTIVDCRYPYEYVGGHIPFAVNINTPSEMASHLDNFDLESSRGKGALIFHCEFSSERAPRMASFVRSADRSANFASYPALAYPEIYILEGGYKAFWEKYADIDICIPNSYVPMLKEEHRKELIEHQRIKKSQKKHSKRQKNHTNINQMTPCQQKNKTPCSLSSFGFTAIKKNQVNISSVFGTPCTPFSNMKLKLEVDDDLPFEPIDRSSLSPSPMSIIVGGYTPTSTRHRAATLSQCRITLEHDHLSIFDHSSK